MRAYLHRCVLAGSTLAALALPACVTHDDGANPVCDCGGEDSNVDTGGDTADTSDTITLDGSTKGGLKGWRVVCDDIAANTWAVMVMSEASGTEATPFSATVS